METSEITIPAPEFAIGQEVWRATTEYSAVYKTCEDCCGQKCLKVIMGDGTEVTIECVACKSDIYGYSSGKVSYHEHQSKVNRLIITGTTFSNGKWTYTSQINSCSYYTFEADTAFATKEDAEAKGRELAEERTLEEIKSLKRKYNQQKTWGWNISYYRKQIRESKKNIEYYEKKLSHAPNKEVEA